MEFAWKQCAVLNFWGTRISDYPCTCSINIAAASQQHLHHPAREAATCVVGCRWPSSALPRRASWHRASERGVPRAVLRAVPRPIGKALRRVIKSAHKMMGCRLLCSRILLTPSEQSAFQMTLLSADTIYLTFWGVVGQLKQAPTVC